VTATSWHLAERVYFRSAGTGYENMEVDSFVL